MEWIARIATHLERQHNLVTRPQAVAKLGKDAVDARVQRGDLQVVHRAVYRPPFMPVPEEQAAMAAVLRCRPQAWLTGEAMLGLFGVEGFSTTDPVRVLVPPERSVSNVSFTVLNDPGWSLHRATTRNVPGVTPARSLADAGLYVTDKQLRVGVDALKWTGLCSNGRLESTMNSLPGHPGAERILEGLHNGTFDPESEGERSLLSSVLAGFVPAPQCQVEILPGIRVDFAWWAVRLALEYDGRNDHDRARDRDRDEERSLRIKRGRWEHLRIRNSMLSKPAELAATLAEIYNERAARHGAPPLVTTGF